MVMIRLGCFRGSSRGWPGGLDRAATADACDGGADARGRPAVRRLKAHWRKTICNVKQHRGERRGLGGGGVESFFLLKFDIRRRQFVKFAGKKVLLLKLKNCSLL
jgi:hypothetical protein